MIYIDKKEKIYNCFICGSREEKLCECEKLTVYIEDDKFVKNNKKLNAKKLLSTYLVLKQEVVKKIEIKFPHAKKIDIYPFFHSNKVNYRKIYTNYS